MNATREAVTPAVNHENPWPGLAPFIECDAAFFHGRADAIRTLLQLVGREDLVLLYGVSGLGKTSLLRAGLFPRLPSALLPVYIRLHFAASAQDSGVSALRNQVFVALHDAAEQRSVELPKDASSGTLWEYFRRRDQPLWGRGNEIVVPLLVFDQFEQLFTRPPDPNLTRQDIDAFLEDLGDLVGGRVPRWLEERLQSPATVDRYVFESTACKAIVSFREEYLAEVKRLRTLVQFTDRNSLRLEPLREADAVFAVRSAAGHLLAPLSNEAEANSATDVAAAIVGQVAERPLSDGEPTVDPAILSVFCTELNRARKARATAGGAPLIDLALVADNKSDQIIGNFYRRAVASAPDSVRRFIEDRLVLPSRTRNSVAEEEAKDLPADAINSLIDSWRILRREVVGRQTQVRIELTHDVLIGPVMQDRQRREDEMHQRPAQRRQRWIAAAVAASIVMVIAGLAFYAAVRIERSRDLAGRAQQVQLTDPLKALLLAVAAAESANTSEAEQALRTVVNGTFPSVVLQSDAKIVDGDFGTASNEFVTVGNDGNVRVWKPASGEVSETRPGHDGAFAVRVMADQSVVTAAVDGVRVWGRRGTDRNFQIADADVFGFHTSRTGLWCGVSRLGGPSVFWNVADGKKITAPAPSETSYRPEPIVIAFDDKGQQLLETGLSGNLRLLDARTGGVLSTSELNVPLEHGTLSADGRMVAVTGIGGTVLYDVTPNGLVMRKSLEVPAALEPARSAKKVAFNRTGTRLLSVGNWGVLVWDTASMTVTTSLVTPEVTYLDAAHVDDDSVAIARVDDVAALRTATELRLLKFHRGAVLRVLFSADGRSLATIGDDGSAALWDVQSAPTIGDVPFGELLARARGRVPRGLSEDYRRTLLTQ